jgi:predicted MPP superfamily phosphohydrolase
VIFGLEPYDFIPFFGQRGVPAPERFGAALAILALFDFVLLAWLVLKGRQKRLDFDRVVIAAVIYGAVTVARAPLLVSAGFSGFGLINVTWNGLIFAVAPVGLLALRQKTSGRDVTLAAAAVATLAVAFWPVAAFARFVEPFRLEVTKVEVDVGSARRGATELKIGVLADLQTDRVTAFERHVVDTLLAQEPDLILIPGDLFHGGKQAFDESCGDLNRLLARLVAPGGVYFVTGDVDPPHYVERLLTGTTIRKLDNEIVRLEIRGHRIAIAGLCTDGPPAAAQSTAREIEAGSDEGELRIVFAHEPDAIGLLETGSRVDLFVAGHTHGGQIVVPFFGPPMTLTQLPRFIAAGGLHRFRDNRIFVSRGSGLERTSAPRIRFLCRPEVAVLTIPPRLERAP